MKAVLLEKTGDVSSGVLRVADVEEPTAGPGEVVLRVLACGVCRSNLHMIEGDWVQNGVPAFLPIIPGHEIVGVIEELGSGVDWLSKGQRVGVQPLWSTCGHCEYCLTGREHLCPHKEITGETVNGGYAEYLLAKAFHCYPVPDNLDDVEAAPLFCPGITAYSAVEHAELSPGKKVAIFGIGGVGHMVLEFAKLTGAHVTAVSHSPLHSKVALELGADEVIDSSQHDPVEAIKASGGADAAIVFAPVDKVIRQAIDSVKAGGLVVIGVFGDLGSFDFVQERRIIGSVIGPRQRMLEVLSLAAAGKVKPVCEVYSLEQAPEALQKLKGGDIRARAVLRIGN